MNEVKWVAGTKYTLEANGASISSAAYAQANDATLTAVNVAGYEYLQFEFTGAFTTAPAAGTVLDIYARPINFDGASADAPAPKANYQNNYVGSIPLDDLGSSTTQYQKPPPMLHPNPLDECEFWLANRTAQSLNAGWTLKVTPMTRAPT